MASVFPAARPKAVDQFKRNFGSCGPGPVAVYLVIHDLIHRRGFWEQLIGSRFLRKDTIIFAGFF